MIITIIKVFFFGCLAIGALIRIIPAIWIFHTKWKEKKAYKQYMYDLEHAKPEEPPFYIMDKLDAFDAVVESNRKLLKVLDDEYTKADTAQKRATIRKRQADIMVKLANTEEKADKLREKNGL